MPPVPDATALSRVQRDAQAALRSLVERSGGRFDGGAIPVEHLPALVDLYDEWVHSYGEHTADGLLFRGRPGLWHALDQLYPLQDPNRWDKLRLAVIAELETRNWTRLSPPRGSVFLVADR